MISTARLYGSAIALVSGAYSVFLATSGREMPASAWLMLALGAVVLGHGAVLLTGLADRLGDASGPLMVAYAVLMLLNQAWTAAGDGMAGGMNGGMGGANGMGWDPGMVALAVLMLAAGTIMTARSGERAGVGM